MGRVAVSRRTKTDQRRDHRVGPLRFNDDELHSVRLAADRAGLSLGAYATAAVVSAARAELDEADLRQESVAGLPEIQAVLEYLEVDLNRPDDHGDRLDRLGRMLAEILSAVRHHGD
jgi:hypothetical protein